MYGSETNRPFVVFRLFIYGLLIGGSLLIPFLLKGSAEEQLWRTTVVLFAYSVFLVAYSYVPLRENGPLTFYRLGVVVAEACLACLFLALLGTAEMGALAVLPIAAVLIGVEHGWRMGLTASVLMGGFAVFLYGPTGSVVGWAMGAAALSTLGTALGEAHRIKLSAHSVDDLEQLDRAYHIARKETSKRQEQEEELYRERRRFEGLVEVALGLSQVTDQERLLQRIVDVASDQLQARGAAVLLAEGTALRARGQTGVSDPMLSALERCASGQLLRTLSEAGELLIFNRGQTSLQTVRFPELLRGFAPLIDPKVKRPGGVQRIDQLLVAPMATAQQKRAFGLLIAVNHNLEHPFTETEAKYVQVLATNAATALKNILFTAELERSHWELIQALAQAIEAKDSYTSNHVGRVRDLSVEIARTIGLDRATTRVLAIAATLHDVGKISTPDRVLMKPGALTDEEYEIMKQHAENGAQILRGIRSLPDGVEAMVRHHHERWDGRGYPQGLKGSEIPLGAQIISIADCFDAMTYDRPYRKGFSKQEALHKMELGCGSQFNPKLLCAFFALQGYVPQTEPTAIETYKSIIGKLRLASTFRGVGIGVGNPDGGTGAQGQSEEQPLKPLLLERN